MKKPIAIISGVGNGSGTGAAAACVCYNLSLSGNLVFMNIIRRLFSRNGFCVALIARRADLLAKTAESVNELGGEEVRVPCVIAYVSILKLYSRLAPSQLSNMQKDLL